MKLVILVFKDGFKINHVEGDRKNHLLIEPTEHISFDESPCDGYILKRLKVTHKQWINRWAK